jgi:hypothetical protein
MFLCLFELSLVFFQFFNPLLYDLPTTIGVLSFCYIFLLYGILLLSSLNIILHDIKSTINEHN